MAGLPVQRGLLVAGHPGHRHCAAELARLAVHARARRRLRKGRGIHARISQSSGSQLERADVEQQRARGIRVVGHVAAGELVGEPGVDGAEHRALPHAALATQPLDLGPGEVGVEHQAGALAEERLAPGGAELVAARGRAPVLPDDGAVQGLAGAGVPRHHGLALVGDPDAAERRPARRLVRFARHRPGDLPDLVRVVLHPAGAGEVLPELAVGAARRAARLVEDDGGGPGGALVDREDHSAGPYVERPAAAAPGGYRPATARSRPGG